MAFGALSWGLCALLFVWARRDYRGPSGRALLLSPFALWEPANYTGAGALRIRRSLICLIVFLACVVAGLAVGSSGAGGKS